jgi:hypothetical protein
LAADETFARAGSAMLLSLIREPETLSDVYVNVKRDENREQDSPS